MTTPFLRVSERVEVDGYSHAEAVRWKGEAQGHQNPDWAVNPFKHMDDIDLDAGENGYLDLTFSKAYPQFISGSGVSAEITISQEQLESAMDSSLALIRWIASQLRLQELEWEKKDLKRP